MRHLKLCPQEKPWGYSTLIFIDNTTEVHRIEVLEGGFCSIHKHENKTNGFYIEKGEMDIELYNPEGTQIDRVAVIREDDFFTVPPGMYHRFVAHQPCIAYEIYNTRIDNGDISRLSVGGRLSDQGETLPLFPMGLRFGPDRFNTPIAR